MAVDKLAGSLQENLLVLATWSDTAFMLVRNSVPSNLFSTDIFRDVINQVYSFIDAHKKPPKDHLPDLVESQIKGKDGQLYLDLVKAVREIRKNINEEYILKQLERFVRQQELKLGIIEAYDFIQNGNIEEAEVAIEKRLKSRLSLFSPGMTLEQALGELKKTGTLRDALPLGIPILDKNHLGPARGELYGLIGPKKGGKSWWLQHLTKRTAMVGERTTAVTLELKERLYSSRIIQTFYSISEREAKTYVSRFKKDELGRVIEIKRELLDRPYLMNKDGVTKQALKEIKGLSRWSKLIRVKQFPTGELTINGLRAYLDALERIESFIPDTLIVDYPKLMKHDPANLRIELGITLERLRGIGVERNIRVCVVGQTNREGVKAGTTRGTDVAEDFSINATADILLTYSQTPAEYQLGLARLGVDASRVSKQHINLMISQNYELGQFCFDSALLMSDYLDTVKEMSGRKDLGEELE